MASLGEPVRLERGKVIWLASVSLEIFVVIPEILHGLASISRIEVVIVSDNVLSALVGQCCVNSLF